MERCRAAHLSSATWVEASAPQPGATVEDATSSPPRAAAVPPEENAARPPLFPFGIRTPAATCASSISTNMSFYEDLPGHHLISIQNLIVSMPDSSYPDFSDEGYVLYAITRPQSGTTLEFAIARLFCRFRLQRTTASPTPMTPGGGLQSHSRVLHRRAGGAQR